MSGWIKFDKDMAEDPRLVQAASLILKRYAIGFRTCDAGDENTVTGRHAPSHGDATRFVANAIRGALVTLWCYADTHIRDDDSLPCDAESLDAIVGIEGFCATMPDEWLEISDNGTVSLPEYCEKNALIPKRKSATSGAERTRRWRDNKKLSGGSNSASRGDVTNRHGDVTPPSPDRHRDASHQRHGDVTVTVDLDQDQDLSVLSESPSETSLAADAAKANGAHRVGPAPCPHQDIVDLYHEVLPELPRIKDWTDLRQGLLRSRWREKPERQDLAWWRRFFEWIRGSAFLMGDAKPGFQGDLEWFVRPSNFVKILEGKYHRDQRFNAA